MPREGYGNLSIEGKRLDKNHRDFDIVISPKQNISYSAWAIDVLENAIKREKILAELFPKLHFVGRKKDGGLVIEEDRMLIDVTVNGKKFSCSKDQAPCIHTLFAAIHPLFP